MRYSPDLRISARGGAKHPGAIHHSPFTSHFRLFLLCTLLLVAGGSALAHHSGAMFDRSKTVVLEGTLKEYRFVAPHSWISVIATADGNGKEERWDVEGATASRMKAQGITPERLKVGDKVTLRIHPLRDGRNAGSLIDITLADGTKMTNNTTQLKVGE